MADDHLVQNHSDGPDVGRERVFLALKPLRRHVAQRSDVCHRLKVLIRQHRCWRGDRRRLVHHQHSWVRGTLRHVKLQLVWWRGSHCRVQRTVLHLAGWRVKILLLQHHGLVLQTLRRHLQKLDVGEGLLVSAHRALCV